MRSRVLTAVGLIPIVLGALFYASPFPLLVLAVLASVACTAEIASLLKSPAAWAGLLLCFLSLMPRARYHPAFAFEEQLCLIGYLAISVAAVYYCAKKKLTGAMMAAYTVFWVASPLWSLVRLHGIHHGSGPWDFATPALLAMVPLWGGDTAAYFVGKAFGKHLLAPKISPKKTVEGAIANVFACVAVAIPLGLWIGIPVWASLVCGLIAGSLGQLGDLFESYVKRQYGVKDSGVLLPGHGGILDRLDSLFFTAPFVYLIVSLVK